MKKPNVLFIVSDQHNAKCTGYAGHAQVKTPNLDRLATEGVVFENAITQNPICTPSRVSFLSGQYCHNHGYYGLNGPNPEGLPSILSHFRRSGYKTAAIGKIHCPEYWIEDDTDVYLEAMNCSIGNRSSEYSDFLGEDEPLEDHLRLGDLGPAGQQSMEGRPSALTYRQSAEGWIASRTIDFIKESAANDEPFFIHASLPRPHQCTAPVQEFWDMYPEAELQLPPNADYDLHAARKAPNLIRTAENWRKGAWAAYEPKTFEAARLRKLRGYYGAITQVDYAVGEMIKAVEDLGLGDDTIVIYTADHGDYATEHGIMEKAPGICHDAITRVPMICWAPERITPNRTKQLVELVDIPPTLASLAGLDTMETADGKDLTPLLQGQDTSLRDIAVTEFAWSKSVRKGDWRLVWYPTEMHQEEYPNGFGELYNLATDPWEMQNLWFETEYQNKVQELTRDLLNWLVTTTRPTTILSGRAKGKPALGNWQQKVRYANAINADGKISPAFIRQNKGLKNYL